MPDLFDIDALLIQEPEFKKYLQMACFHALAANRKMFIEFSKAMYSFYMIGMEEAQLKNYLANMQRLTDKPDEELPEWMR